MGKEHNFNGSFLSYYMQEWERRMLECVYNMMAQHQYIRGRDAALCYDGIMIHEENLMNTSISTVLKQCGFNDIIVQWCNNVIQNAIGL